ncbi:MAG TPA: hypothetical protein VK897_21015 [Anaerolineales bacterium]|nr:hypothetical protein [Anaerolineales bacterium]
MINDEKDALLDRMIQFLLDIGFQFREVELSQPTFVPGIAIGGGTLLIDKSKLLYPGDLLHEAGHLAVIPAEKRMRIQGDVGKKAAEEMMAIAWSYAAAVHLGLEPSVVFHEGGYKGGAVSLIENFTNGRYIGVPMLQWIGLTVDERRAKELGIEPYPRMIKWVLD